MSTYVDDPLGGFSPAVRSWFEETFGRPTPPQSQAWPVIQRGEHTLILAPTGSGKTLAAFLSGIDRLYRELPRPVPEVNKQKARRRSKNKEEGAGVRLLYVSPLKALNNDIERNLRVPLKGIQAVAERAGEALPEIRVAVRTGDTPAGARADMLKHPPHILITTPESLYLMLTAPRAREMFRTVETVIVDEIHTLSGNKRGVHLSLSLERLNHLAGRNVQRIGLSATIKPLEEVARFLGGQEVSVGEGIEASARPVTVVDAHYGKPLRLEVVTAVDDFRELPGTTIWPSVIPRVLEDIRRHQTTLIFANNRRLAERTADRLNAQLAAEDSEEIAPGSTEALAPGGIAADRGIFAIGAEGPIRAHHGSMSKTARRQMEEELKSGRLPALVGTSSLELGIDIGSVDLVVQLQSPKSVAQGLQRVGRSGHLVGETSHGRIYPTFREDLVEAAAIARGMLEGDVENTFTPQNALDVLAQQIVAMVAVEDWTVPAIFDLVRQAYPYQNLTLASFRSVIEMLSGKYYLDMPDLRPASALRPKIAWDRVHDRLTALPGSRLLAISNAGTIPDTGAFGVYLSDGKTKIGELDEEFVYETRVGDVFLLGSSVWRVHEITDDRIIAADAAGATPRMPFWNGDLPWRPFELGARIGRFRREVAERIERHRDEPEQVEDWLKHEYALDDKSARNLVDHVKRQLDAVGAISSDTEIIVESFQNAVGDPHMVIHSPFGGRVNGAWALALTSALRELTGVDLETQTNDDGIIFRLPQADREPPVEVVRQMKPNEARERILRELPNSAVFGSHFRMNAARSLLLSKGRAGKRTPFWLQRLKARDLLALVRQFDDFPIIAETYRDCLRDVLDLPHLEQVLARIQNGEIRVVPIDTAVPSPVAAGLLFNFISVYIYEWDAPKAERQLQTLSFKREAIENLLNGISLSDLFKPEAIAEVSQRARHMGPGYQPRSIEELSILLLEVGDLTTDEVIARCPADGSAWLSQLALDSRAIEMAMPTPRGMEPRWVPSELAEEYRAAFAANTVVHATGDGREGPGEAAKHEQDSAISRILRRYLSTSGPVIREEILNRYFFPPERLEPALAGLVGSGHVVRGNFTAPDRDQYCDVNLLEQIHRRTVTILRKEIRPVSPYVYSDFLTRHQHLHPSDRLEQPDALKTLEQLRGVDLPGVVWERDVLPARIARYDPVELTRLTESGELVWVASGIEAKRARVRLFFRGDGGLFLSAPDDTELRSEARAVYDFLKAEGASFATDIQTGLGLTSAAVEKGLSELVLAGLVTNDSLDVLRDMLTAGLPALRLSRRGPTSLLETEITSRLRRPHPITQNRYYDTKRRVARRLGNAPTASPWSGRWSPVHRAGILGPSLTEEERSAKLARVLLARYGVLTREVLEHEEEGRDWSRLYPQLQRMELRGEARRGYFVEGLSGLQFALPEAVEALRSDHPSDDDAMVVLNATDPANLFGGSIGDVAIRFARIPSTHVVIWRGRPVLVAEDSGQRMSTEADLDLDVIRRALAAYLARPNPARHVVVAEWNGTAIVGSPGESLLQKLGFYRVPSGMEWWSDR